MAQLMLNFKTSTGEICSTILYCYRVYFVAMYHVIISHIIAKLISSHVSSELILNLDWRSKNSVRLKELCLDFKPASVDF